MGSVQRPLRGWTRPNAPSHGVTDASPPLLKDGLKGWWLHPKDAAERVRPGQQMKIYPTHRRKLSTFFCQLLCASTCVVEVQQLPTMGCRNSHGYVRSFYDACVPWREKR